MTRRIYAYTVVGKDSQPWQRSGPALVSGVGQIKVGETTKPTARARIAQQLGTAYPRLEGVRILLDELAVRKDGTEFRDHDLHHALVASGVRKDQEWFEATLDEVRAAVVAVKNGTTFESQRTADFPMRPEQEDAVALTAGYFTAHAADGKAPKFLWNAKMRFGKTFTTYQVAREMGWTRVLVLTYKPAVKASWRDDLQSHVDFDGWRFVDRDTPADEAWELADSPDPLVWFASFQDMSGRTTDGQVKDHNEPIHLIEWDCVVIDEYHFGAWRETARDLYDPTDQEIAEAEEPDDRVTQDDISEIVGLTAHRCLYLSGTPFRAITNGEFTEDAIFNWTYVDEQTAKADWERDNREPLSAQSPYIDLPRMEMYSYEMDENASRSAEDGEFNEFSLNEFFKAKRTDPTSRSFSTDSFGFTDPDSVNRFLEMLRGNLSEQMKMLVLTGQKPPFPFDSRSFGDAMKHTVWYLPDVAACYAMRDLLATHPFFGTFEVVLAAGPRAPQGAAALPPVKYAIADVTKKEQSGTITLSCGKLMTGVTVPEWGAILMLRSLKSPESYFQAAFRVQSPWAYRKPDGPLDVVKHACYVFEFDPNRALQLVAEYGAKLATTGEATPSEAIGQLINYLPIYSFAGGRMLPLDAEAVLEWATAGIGATALAQRWNSPLLVDVNEHTLSAVLDQPGLMDKLAQIEDFRALVNNASQVVTSTKKLKKDKRQKAEGEGSTPEERKEQTATAKLRKEIREKLQKFLAKIPVFMYATDFREEALKHVIESLDSTLFERVTGLTVDDFQVLNQIGLFNAQNMNAAIYQFKSFENASLDYALDEDERRERGASRVGLWDQTIIEEADVDPSAG
ncbi:GIY-YIG nuclease family protein [Promicromonospora soli]